MTRRVVPLVLLVLGLVVAGAGVAHAHTGWQPEAAAPGSIATLTLSVAAENDAAGTVKVELFFPDGVELTTVDAPPVTGWTVATSPTGPQVTWSRPSGPPGESPQLPIRLGAFPAAPGQVQFKVIQTYADGTVARWIQDWPAGAPEPEMPGPVLKLESGAPGDIPPSTTTSSSTTTTRATTTTTAADESDDDGGGDDSTGLILAGIALFLVAVGVTATIVLRRNRARMDAPGPPTED